MNDKTKSEIKYKALHILQELAMKDVFETCNIINIEKCIFKPEYVITVSRSNFNKFIDMLVDCGLSYCHYNEGETKTSIFIYDQDIYKLSNEKIKRLHDCIEDL